MLAASGARAACAQTSLSAPTESELRRVMLLAPPGTDARIRRPVEPGFRHPAWREGVIEGWSHDTVSVRLNQYESYQIDVAGPWDVEANPSGRASRGMHALRGAFIGSVLAAAATVAYALGCDKSHSDGPSCGIVIIVTPQMAVGGAIAGAVIGASLPAAEWKSLRP